MQHRFPVLPAFSLLLNCLAISLVLTAGFIFGAHGQPPSPLNGTSISPYFLYDGGGASTLVSFDWDQEGLLHYTVGDSNWGLKLEVYKVSGDTPVPVYSTTDVWAGSRLTCIGATVYFNDGGDFGRSDFNYYKYDAVAPSGVQPLLSAPYDASLWGLATRHAGEFFASGSVATWGPAALFYSLLDTAGDLVSVPPLKFGDVGDSPGPLAFDAFGNLYYVPGYAFMGTATIYRWSAQEVAAALADPETSALSSAGAGWAVLPAPYDGATGMVTDRQGNVYVTATAWGAPSQVVAFRAHDAAPLPVAEYSGRLETLRFRDNGIHVSCADGIFRIPLLTVESGLESDTLQAHPGETVVFTVQASGGVGTKTYQWYRMNAEKAAVPVGSNLSHYALTAQIADSGASFYCVVSDDLSVVESSAVLLTVQAPVPAYTPLMLFALVLVFASLGASCVTRKTRQV